MHDYSSASRYVQTRPGYIATHRQYIPLRNDTRVQPAADPFVPSPGPIRRLAERVFQPRIVYPDATLGLPPDNFIAFRKIADDKRGNGSGGSRRWDQHHDF